MSLNIEIVKDMNKYILEREKIRFAKAANKPKPWTEDIILQTYRFCNVFREHDTVTQWLARNWRAEKYWDEPNFIAAMILARTINWPDTMRFTGFPHSWNAEEYCGKLDAYQNQNGKTYTAAYFITAGPTGIRKNLWVTGNANSYFYHPPKMYPSLQETWEGIIDNNYPCVGPFIAGQVVADLKQTKHLENAYDWWDWAALGPGSMRGLNRLYERNIKAKISQEQGLEEMIEVRSAMKANCNTSITMCLQDFQNNLCEFDKYERARWGQGKPKQLYRGGKAPESDGKGVA